MAHYSVAPVLILGAGINGAALARALVAQGIPVIVVDRADLASGATSRSSRLIHGGLRYLEYGEVDLVREAIADRARLLHGAPQFVRRLRFCIPVPNRLGGLGTTVARFLGRTGKPTTNRGLWLLRAGLGIYDRLERDPSWPRHCVHRLGDPDLPALETTNHRWLCSYWDAQMLYPERFVLALLKEAERLARSRDVDFSLLTYCRVQRDGSRFSIHPCHDDRPTREIVPSLIVNATGSWGDDTLRGLQIPRLRLFGGTRGSHVITDHCVLRDALRRQAVYVEALGGRPVFIMPFGKQVLIGTTDVSVTEAPERAVATEVEIAYLLETVNSVFPQARLRRGDIHTHYSGVRPLPHSDATTPAAITRAHHVDWVDDGPVPVATIVGGKLSTCLSLSQQLSLEVSRRLGVAFEESTSPSDLPGAQGFPRSEAEFEELIGRLAEELAMDVESAQLAVELLGGEAESILRLRHLERGVNVRGSQMPQAIARHALIAEWVTNVSDLVERRLMLAYHADLSRGTLRHLTELMVECGRLLPVDVDKEVERACERLQMFYGKTIE